jgi:hypothetical protein
MTKQRRLTLIVTSVFIMSSGGISIALGTQVRDALKNTTVIVYPAKGRPVDHTVAEALKELAPQAKLLPVNDVNEVKGDGVLRVAVADEDSTGGPQKYGLQIPGDKEWMFVRLTPAGDGELVSSKPHLLYAFFCQIRDQWLGEDVAVFTKGRMRTAAFQWLGGDDGIFIFLCQLSVRHYDPESTVKELARLGCSHLSVNGLGVPFSYEEGPPGEIYFRFYNASPDLDQFVETELNRGTYPPEYLRANLNLLKENAALALKYGLTPGLTICAPRSVPESLLERFPFLRGARVDHTFRSYRPRYTLTLAHPVVRWHYAQLMKRLMQEVPQLGYVYIWTNDSGSGFEYTLTTYPGRNGGAYLVREWKSEEEIAKVAGENVVRYLRLLRDAASEINPAFRVTFGLGSFPVEGETILQGMNNRLDLQVSPLDRLDPVKWQKEQALLRRGSSLLAGTSLVSNYVVGIPFPWLAHDRLEELISAGLNRASITVDAKSLAPHSINREVARAFQLGDSANVEKVIEETAACWVGAKDAATLTEAWRLTDRAVRAFPRVVLYQESWAFAPYRLWVRPMVPDIAKISAGERAYYEKYMLSTFNNPTLVDLAADALWKLVPTADAERIMKQFDQSIWPPLDGAIVLLEKKLSEISTDEATYVVFSDQRDRLLGLRCHFRTLRNTAAWIAGVHGYLEANDQQTKQEKRQLVHDMVLDEIQNTKDLLKLWENSTVDFIPVSTIGETMVIYGENLGELLKKKIQLMTGRENDEPYIDPNFMWQMPSGFTVPKEEYLKY